MLLAGPVWLHYRIAVQLAAHPGRKRSFFLLCIASCALLAYRVYVYATDLNPGCFGLHARHPTAFNYTCFFCWTSILAWEVYFTICSRFSATRRWL